MNFARWATEEELKEILTIANHETKIEKSGIPFIYDNKNLYIEDSEGHNLIIGSTGSGKTQSITLPELKLALKASESIVLNDIKGELYKETAALFEKENYKVILLDFDESKYGNNWNPLTLPYKLYKNGDKDKAIELLEEVGYHIMLDKKEVDSFWSNSATNLFVGLALYLFENAEEEEINLNSIYNLQIEGEQKYNNEYNFDKLLNSLNVTEITYMYLAGTIKAPLDTRGGILSVFKQKLNIYVSRERMSNMLSTSDFNLQELVNKKYIVYIKSNPINNNYNTLVAIFVKQICDSIMMNGNKEKRVNIILDEFERICQIRNFPALLNHSRSIKIRFTIIIKSYLELINNYGIENTEILKTSFLNLIYLLSNDINTLKEISIMCGNKSYDSEKNIYLPLISIEELKLMKNFEAIIIAPRIMPIKTKLIPDYQIDWRIKEEKKDLPQRNSNSLKIYSFINDSK